MSSHAKSKVNLNVIRFKRRPMLAKQGFRVDNHGSIVLLRPFDASRYRLRESRDWQGITATSRIGQPSFSNRAISTTTSQAFDVTDWWRDDPTGSARQRQLSHPRFYRRRRNRLFGN